jgi:hypothetical protein
VIVYTKKSEGGGVGGAAETNRTVRGSRTNGTVGGLRDRWDHVTAREIFTRTTQAGILLHARP